MQVIFFVDDEYHSVKTMYMEQKCRELIVTKFNTLLGGANMAKKKAAKKATKKKATKKKAAKKR